MAQLLVGPSKQLKQLIILKLNITLLRIPTGRSQTSWAIYKCGQGIELGAIEKQIQVVVKAGLEPGTTGL